jgi:hypothetical protein
MPFLPAPLTMADEDAGRMMQCGTTRRGSAADWPVHRLVRLAALLATATALGGCAAMSEKIAGTASEMPVIGLPSGIPERPAEQPAYPAVHDIPPPRSTAVLSEVEQQKLEDELTAARDAQRGSDSTSAARQKKPKKPSPGVVPVSSNRTIY